MNRQKIALATLVFFAHGAFAGEAAYDFIACTHGKRTMLESNSEFTAYATEGWGVVASSTTKDWENASTHCTGYVRVVAGKPVGKGVCKWTEAGGDSGIGEYEFSTAGATWTWLSGTGKLKGISGGGTFKEVFSARTVDPGTAQGCRRDWGKYTLPD
jgi:hypothetical protein